MPRRLFRRRNESSLAAKLRSDSIDRELQASDPCVRPGGTNSDSQRVPVKVLVLGPPEAGKSTFIRHLRATHDGESLSLERDMFKLAILLTLLRSIKAVAATFDGPQHTRLRRLLDLIGPLLCEDDGCVVAHMLDAGRSLCSPLGSPSGSSICTSDALSVLSSTSVPLVKSLHVVNEQEELSSVLSESQFPLSNLDGDPYSPLDSDTLSSAPASLHAPARISPRVWQENARLKRRSTLSTINQSYDLAPVDSGSTDLPSLISRYRYEILKVYNQAITRGLVVHDWRREQCPDALLELNESSVYILENVDRIATPDYQPNADDIMHVRLATIGMEEYTIDVGPATWRVCDPCGIKGKPSNWLPHFEDAGAIVFVCAISTFNEVIDDEAGTNRMVDALKSFESIAKNKLLAKVAIIVLFNKCDVLAKKLKQGQAQMAKYFPQFDGNNEVQDVIRYFADEFLKLNAFPSRKIYVHSTTAISKSAMRSMTQHVTNAIAKSNQAQGTLAV